MKEILSFDGRVNIAVRIVTEQYPEAVLYEADGIATEGPTTDPAKINQIRVVFRTVDGNTVIIKETGYGEFGKPQLFKEPWLEDRVIQWPVEMDLLRASKLKEEAGFTNPYSTVTLRNPLRPEPTNPYFIFDKNDDGDFVFVDTVTGYVTSGN